jgi:quercetin dioxygenase-like cupin family protein
MQVIRKDQNPEEDRTNAPLFYGGKVTGQPIVGGDVSENFSFAMVNFSAGAKNKFHTHTRDQILYVTKGRGYITTETERIEITEDDTAFIPAGEKHWHGATDDSDFSHISVTVPDRQTTICD